MISSKSDHRPQDWRFNRQQSRQLRQREWDDREQLKVPESWMSLGFQGMGLVVFMAFVILVVMHG